MTGRKRYGRILGCVVIFVIGLVACGYVTRLERDADRAFRRQEWDRAVALYSRLVDQHPDRTDLQARYWWARLRAAQAHLLQAHTFEQRGDLEQALVELELAADLDPTNAAIRERLDEVRRRLRRAPESGTPPMQLPEFPQPPPEIWNRPITAAHFVDAPLSVILRSIVRSVDLNLILDADLPDVTVTVDWSGVTFGQAIDQLADTYGLLVRYLEPRTLVIAPDTPEKRRQYRDTWAYTFRIEHARVDAVLQVLQQTMRLESVAGDPQRGTITVIGSRRQIEAVARILRQIDVAPAEILIHVDVLEVNRTLLQQYGLQIASPGTTGIDTAVQPDPEIRLDPGPILSRSDFVLVNLPGLVARLIKQSSHARLIDSVPVRTVEGVPARIQFGNEVPVPQTTFVPIAGGGVSQQPITSFTYRVVGLNLDVTPTMHADGTITLKVVVESSSVAGTGFGGIPVFSTSRIEKTIRLRPDETSLIAGLIRQQVRLRRESLPGLEAIPLIGALFQHRVQEREDNEIIVLLTPYVLRSRPAVQRTVIAVPPPERRERTAPTRIRIPLRERMPERPGMPPEKEPP